MLAAGQLGCLTEDDRAAFPDMAIDCLRHGWARPEAGRGIRCAALDADGELVALDGLARELACLLHELLGDPRGGGERLQVTVALAGSRDGRRFKDVAVAPAAAVDRCPR